MRNEITFDEWFASCYEIMIVEDRYSWFGGNYIAVACNGFDEDMMHVMSDLSSDDIMSEPAKDYLIKDEKAGYVITGHGKTLDETIKMIKNKAIFEWIRILDKDKQNSYN
jgi:hypothetical protein